MRIALASMVALSVLASASGVLADDKQACIGASESAQKLRDDHHLSKAREQFLVCARDVCPPAVKKDCSEAMADLDKRTPTIVFRAKDPHGGDLVAVRVSVDGSQVGETLDGKALRIDPGVHTFHFETAGQDPVDQKIVIAEGEHDRAIVATFGKAQEATGPGVPPTAPAPSPRGAPVGAFVIGGIGLVALGVGAAFYGLGLSQRSGDLNGACGTVETNVSPQTSCDDEKSAIKTKLVVGDILTGVGIVGVATSLIWIIVHYTGGHRETAATALDFRPLAGGGVASASFSF